VSPKTPTRTERSRSGKTAGARVTGAPEEAARLRDRILARLAGDSSPESMVRVLDEELSRIVHPVVTALYLPTEDLLMGVLGAGRHLWRDEDLQGFLLHLLTEGQGRGGHPRVTLVTSDRPPPAGTAELLGLDIEPVRVSVDPEEESALLLLLDRTEACNEALEEVLHEVSQALRAARSGGAGIRAPAASPRPARSPELVESVRALRDRIGRGDPAGLDPEALWSLLRGRLEWDLAALLLVDRRGSETGAVLLGSGNPSPLLEEEVTKRLMETYRMYANDRDGLPDVRGRWTGLDPLIPPVADLRSYFFVPVQRGEDVGGVFYLGHRSENAFSSETIAAFNLLAGEAGGASSLIRRSFGEPDRRIGALLHAMADGVVLADPRGRILSMNPAARRLLSLAPEASVPDLESLFARGLEGLREVYRSRGDRSDTIRREIRLHEPEERILCVDVFGARDPGLEPWASVIVLHDITPFAHQGGGEIEYVSAVSHELRNPLAVLKSAVQVLLGGTLGTLNERQEKFLHLVMRNSNRLERLLHDLLEISRIQAGRTTVHPADVEIATLLEETLEGFRSTAERRGIELEVRVSRRIGRAWIDGDKVVQILSNLVGNALKFTPTDGRIGVTARLAGGKRAPERYGGALPVSWLRPRMLELEVRDTGPGIDQGDLQKIFAPFYQASPGGKGSESGAGLGLSITRTLVRAHLGEIRVESRRGRGTTVSVLLPADRASWEAFRFVQAFLQMAGRRYGREGDLLLARIEKDPRLAWEQVLERCPSEEASSEEGGDLAIWGIDKARGLLVTECPEHVRDPSGLLRPDVREGGRARLEARILPEAGGEPREILRDVLESWARAGSGTKTRKEKGGIEDGPETDPPDRRRA
jgi:signal transduction histidine kinase